MGPVFFYMVTLVIYAAIFALQALGFNLQFGYAGIVNLAYIVSVAVGAYMTAIAGIGQAPHEVGVATYVGGFSWAFPWDMIFGVAIALVFSALLGGAVFYRLHGDYLAVTMIILGSGFLVLVNNYPPLFNGSDGLFGVNGPWQSMLPSSGGGYQLAFLGFALALLLACWWLCSRVTSGPLGRTLKAIREDDVAASSLGANPVRYKMWAFVIGGGIGGLSGSLLVLYDGSWNTGAWALAETLVLLAAVIVGGRGRHTGAMLGSVLVITGVTEATKYLPTFGNANLLASMQTVLVGVIILAFLWFRPQGILPEKLESFKTLSAAHVRRRTGTASATGGDVHTPEAMATS